MGSKPAKSQKDFRHTWYLREWMEQADPPKKQVSLEKELGWSRGKANAVWHGQQYTQDLIEDVAPWLNIRPFELLLHPEVAMAIRRVREDAARIVSDAPASATPEAQPRSRTGTDG